MNVPHEHSRLATPESDLTTCSFKKHDAGYNLFEGDPHQVLTVAKAWHYLISIVIRISLQLPSCDGTGVDPLRTLTKGVTVE
jgi:hypothetical protein